MLRIKWHLASGLKRSERFNPEAYSYHTRSIPEAVRVTVQLSELKKGRSGKCRRLYQDELAQHYFLIGKNYYHLKDRR